MRKDFFCVAIVLLGMSITFANSGASLAGAASANASPQTERITVPAGTRILIRTTDAIDSSQQRAGFRFTATLETNLQAEDTVVAPRGTTVHGKLTQATSAGRMAGGSDLTLELTDIIISGTAYPLLTSTYEVKSKGEGGSTARNVIGGAGLGALIGGIAGRGVGAGIGAAAGAGAGTAASAARKGEQIQIPSESLLEFRLEQPVALPVTG